MAYCNLQLQDLSKHQHSGTTSSSIWLLATLATLRHPCIHHLPIRSLLRLQLALDLRIRPASTLKQDAASFFVKMATFTLDFTSYTLHSEIQSSGNIEGVIHLTALSSPFYCESHADEGLCINVPVKLLELNAPIIHVDRSSVCRHPARARNSIIMKRTRHCW
jgi:hypothetical protein